jgi:hypothetical protein
MIYYSQLRVWSSGFSRSVLLFSVFSVVNSSAAVQQAWVTKYNLGQQSTNEAVALAIDSKGDIIVGGHRVIAPEQPWPISSPRKYSPYILLKYSPTGTQMWARTYSSQGGSDDQVRAMKLDAAGNIFVTGASSTLMYSPDGMLLWEQAYPGRALAVDNEHVYVTGFSNTIFATAKLSKVNGSNVWLRTFNQFEGDLGLPSQAVGLNQNTNLVIAGGNICYWHPRGPQYVNMYILGYSSSGAELWRNSLPDACYFASWNVKALVTDAGGNVYVMGNSSVFYATYFTAKFDPAGNFVWQYYLQGLAYDAARAMVLAADTTLYMTGASLDPQVGRQFGTVKLDTTAGTNIWHRQYGGQGRHEANGLGLDAAANIYVTGKSAYPTVDTPNDFATIKYDPDGNLKWAKRFDGPANLNDEATAIAVTPNGDVYVTGFSTTSSNLIEITTIKYTQVSPIEKKSNGNILLTFCGAPGSNYVIEACSTLTNWTNIGSAVANSSGVYTFEDTNAPIYQQRFYRTVTE